MKFPSNRHSSLLNKPKKIELLFLCWQERIHWRVKYSSKDLQPVGKESLLFTSLEDFLFPIWPCCLCCIQCESQSKYFSIFLIWAPTSSMSLMTANVLDSSVSLNLILSEPSTDSFYFCTMQFYNERNGDCHWAAVTPERLTKGESALSSDRPPGRIALK